MPVHYSCKECLLEIALGDCGIDDPNFGFIVIHLAPCITCGIQHGIGIIDQGKKRLFYNNDCAFYSESSDIFDLVMKFQSENILSNIPINEVCCKFCCTKTLLFKMPQSMTCPKCSGVFREVGRWKS